MIDKDKVIKYYNNHIGGCYKNYREQMISIIIESGYFLINRNVNIIKIIKKKYNNKDITTNIDYEIEKKIINKIKNCFPNHTVLGEETSNNQKNDFIWIVDPIDGTLNFKNNLCIYCISIALSYKNEIILGAIFDPIRNELFFAQKKYGSWLNCHRINITKKLSLNECIISTDLFYDDNLAIDNLKKLIKILPLVRTQRILGSSALSLAYISCGRLDIYFHNYILPWDFASGKLLIEEAGGKVTNLFGKKMDLFKDRTILTTNKKLHKKIQDELKNKKE